MHHTPFRELLTAPVGFAVGWMAHFVAFQVSANGTWMPVLLV
jgi:hypothetical protein